MAGRLLGFVLKPRGRELPVGEFRTVDPSFSAFDWPDKPVVFKFRAYSDEEEPLGTYVGLADESTVCLVEGQRVDLRGLLDSLGTHVHARVVANEPGRVAVIELR